MANKQRSKGPHNKIQPLNVGLPIWYRSLLMAIDPKSNSRALRLLVTHALQNGAAERFLSLPAGTIDPEAVAQSVLAGQTLAQAVGGYDRMRRHLATYDGDVDRAMAAALENRQDYQARQTQQPAGTHPTTGLPMTAAEAFELWGDDDDESPAPAPQPIQPAQVAPAAPISRSTASTIAETEAMMAEIQDWCRVPPPQ